MCSFSPFISNSDDHNTYLCRNIDSCIARHRAQGDENDDHMMSLIRILRILEGQRLNKIHHESLWNSVALEKN